MSYTFQPGCFYRMPTHFGPSLGPRQGPDGQTFDCKDSPDNTAIAIPFLTDAAALDTLLPPGFSLAHQPIVTLTFTCMKNIQWLAGRGYNMLGVSFPATWRGKGEPVTGSFLAVLWENLAEPIITGREELGYSKIFCDLPDPITTGDTTTCSASWMGFEFLRMTFTHQQPGACEIDSAFPSQGTLHYKYMPRTSAPGQADASYAVLTPLATPNRVIHETLQGVGQFHFSRARWEDMPTQYPIVNTLADLPVLQILPATLTRSTGGKDIRDMRILP